MNLIFCFIIGFIGGFFFSTAISVSDKTQDGFKEQEEKKHGEIHFLKTAPVIVPSNKEVK